MKKAQSGGRRAAHRRWSLTTDRVRALLAVGTVVGLGAIGTSAAWTDQSTATSGQFATGSIDLKVGSPAVNNDPPAFTTGFALSNMKPSDTTQSTLQVNNTGTVPFIYTITGTATNSGAGADQLGSAMSVQIYPNSTCTGGTVLNSPAKFTFSATTARALAAGADETLCFKATLPATADTALQAQSSVATFTLTATSS